MFHYGPAFKVKDKTLKERKKKCGQDIEYPRQQENKIYEPEVMQFKASQKLLNVDQYTVQKSEGNGAPQKTKASNDSLTDDDGYIDLGPAGSPSQISTTDTIYDGPLGTSPVNMKLLAKQFGLNSSYNDKVMSSSAFSKYRDRYSSLSSDGSYSSLYSNGDNTNFHGYTVIAKLNPALIPRSDSSATLSSITSELPPTHSTRTSSSASDRSSASSRSSLSSYSSVTSKQPPSPPSKRAFKALFNNLTVIDDPKFSSDFDSDDSVTSQLPHIHKVFPSPSLDPRRSSTTVGSYSDNVISMGDAKDIYRSIKPEYTFKESKTDSSTSMDSTQTESDIFPLGEGFSPGGTSQQSFEPALSFRSSTTSLSSIKSEIIFPKAKIGLDSDKDDDDETHTFSSASQRSQSSSIISELSSSDSSCCLTAQSDIDDDGLKSDISCVCEIFEYALHSSPQKLEIGSDKCAVFYLENHSSNELFIALDTPHGIDCSPTDMTIDGHKKKKIVVIAKKSMLPGTRNKIRASYKLKNETHRLKIPFSIV